MTPIIESNEEDPTNHDLDGLDALWANFRLPIPIATKGKYPTDDGNNGYSFAKHHDEWLLQALDLLRLLHTMNQQYANPKAAAQIRRLSSTTISRERRMKGQITLAYSSLAKLERTFPVHDVDDDANQAFYQNCHGVLQQLRMDTEETCDKFQRWLDRRSQQQQQSPERDLIYDIFLAPDPESNEEEQSEGMLDEFDEDGEVGGYDEDFTDNNANTPSSSPIPSQRHQEQSQWNKNQEEIDPVEFQKQQQELLEEELADMAERLKSSTLAMNATLQTQTKELDVMEDLAQANLDTVTDTAKKVGDRLTKKKGWKKKLATWSLIGTVLGMWVLCFMIMRTVPKRRLGKVPNWFGRGSLFDKGLGKAKEGGTRVWKTLESLLSGEEVGPSGMPTAWERGRAQEEWENQERRKINEERKEQARRWHDQQRQEKEAREGQQRKKQQQEEVQEECEILGDGTQVCSNAKDEALAREIAAERKKRRIEEKMANAPVVEAVDYVEDEKRTGSVDEEEDTIHDADRHDEKDPMGCIPPNDEIHLHENAVDSLSKALSQIEKIVEESSEGSTQRIQLSRQYEKLQAEHKKHASMFEMERNKARSVFWAERENRIKARDLNRGLGSVSFCEGEAEEGGTFGGGEPSPELGDEGNDAERYARYKTARTKAEEERKLRQEKFQEEARRAEEAQRKAETEMKRLEQARAGAKAAKRKEDMERKKARLEEAERQEREVEEKRLAAEAMRQEELAKLEQHRRERERILDEQRKKQEGEARRLAEEEVRLEADRLEQDNLAAEAAKKDELRRLREEQVLAERMTKEEEEARRLAEEEARLDAEWLEQERLAAEQAELDRLEQERNEQDKLMAEQREKEKEEARRLAEEEARLEAERLEQERLSAEEAKREEKARQRSNAVANAEAEARRSIELSKEIAADNLDFLPSDVRLAAGRIKNEILAHYISTSPEMVDASDRSGWRPIHEAARAGNIGGIQLLVDAGCDLTLKTGRSGKGGTALWWAIQRYGEDHNAVRLLRFHGALEDGPA